MSDFTNCFFAYPENPPDLSETIENTIVEINRQGSGFVRLQSWRTLKVTGKLIISEVCDAINECELFICDLTYINPNVLFELGYAIAKEKRVWITLDTSREEAMVNYNKMMLFQVGYAGYQNSHQLSNVFFLQRPYEDIESTLYYRKVVRSATRHPRSPALLYLKSSVETDASIQLSKRLTKAKVQLLIDDPHENNSQTLMWYIQNTQYASAVITHFQDDVRGTKDHRNARYSFVSGMAYGFGRHLLMLAHAPFRPPFDYRDLLHIHNTATQCIKTVNDWLPSVERLFSERQKSYMLRLYEIGQENSLRMIDLGEDIAENEEQSLPDYFIPTAVYTEVVNPPSPPSMIYVGRKGSGKTAHLYAITSLLGQDPRNHICIIKPVSYELQGVLNLLQSNIFKAEPGYLIESLWKFLVYTELGQSVYTQIMSKPVYYARTDEEEQFIDYVQRNSELILIEFTARMERMMTELCKINAVQHTTIHRRKVSEILHDTLLNGLRETLGKVLEKKTRVFVIIDNLDKAWTRGGELDLLSDFIFGLLSVTRAISEDFRKQGITWRPTNLSLLIFLRSDIFSYIMSIARERDKLTFKRLELSDPLFLQRVIAERFCRSLEQGLPSDKIWEEYFVPTIQGIPTKDYLIQQIIPRPRDIIYLCKASLAQAVNRGHSCIEETDILQAQKEYSQYAFNSLEAETASQLGHCEELLYEFVGMHTVVTRKQIETLVKKVGIPEEKTRFAIDLLCDSTFLGLETGPNKFEFIYDESRKRVLQSLAEKNIGITGEERFMINIPFHSYLEITSL